MLQCGKSTRGGTSKPRALGWLLSGLSPLERQEMPLERPYPGQLWKHDSTRVLVVSVHLNTVTPMSSSPEDKASRRAWAAFSLSSNDCGADRAGKMASAVWRSARRR